MGLGELGLDLGFVVSHLAGTATVMKLQSAADGMMNHWGDSPINTSSFDD